MADSPSCAGRDTDFCLHGLASFISSRYSHNHSGRSVILWPGRILTCLIAPVFLAQALFFDFLFAVRRPWDSIGERSTQYEQIGYIRLRSGQVCFFNSLLFRHGYLWHKFTPINTDFCFLSFPRKRESTRNTQHSARRTTKLARSTTLRINFVFSTLLNAD